MTDEIEVEEKITFKFSELSDSAKQFALDAERYSEGYLDHEWWDHTYEHAVAMGAILGIEIASSQERTVGRRIRTFMKTGIMFSGFSSQGDGASFKGSYAYQRDAVEKLTLVTQDSELHRIAQQLTLMQLTHRLLGHEPFTATITISGRDSHSGTMSIEIDDDTWDARTDFPETDLLRLMRDFADWIYKQLEDEHDHLMSDDVVAQQLEDQTFDESGAVI